ncbi:SAM-dependent methyltransferase [Saccharopolyspora lacisalsi]|uniref:SAM-dependent methyltransferase n=1 Tax=Halosaccharopolyspora lacisalsi TaxID=1000566 RepID=A0A839DYE5_9PSEU|nr:SAM-dependent methyltransferase [Halosaccharopolyspora lacisalsi]
MASREGTKEAEYGMAKRKRLSARELDLESPCAARIYDAFLGGNHNFGVERRFVERAEEALPGITESYRENRAFLRRTVEYLISRGIRQFLDIGSGTPTIGHVHDIAERRTNDFRVLYVDNEPLTVMHSSRLLTEEPRAEIVLADLREPDSVLRAAAEQLDLDRPIALLFSAVLHHIPDEDDPLSLVDTYQQALAPDSHVVISHVTASMSPEHMHVLDELYAESADPLFPRGSDRIDALFGDFELLLPGTGALTRWRPDPESTTTAPRYPILHGGLAHKKHPKVWRTLSAHSLGSLAGKQQQQTGQHGHDPGPQPSELYTGVLGQQSEKQRAGTATDVDPRLGDRRGAGDPARMQPGDGEVEQPRPRPSGAEPDHRPDHERDRHVQRHHGVSE